MRLKSILYILLLFGVNGVAEAYSIIGEGVSKSTFIYRLDDPSAKLDQRNFAYIKAGTRILISNKNTIWRGSERKLILTEDGIWGYIKGRNLKDPKPWDRNFWDKDGLFKYQWVRGRPQFTKTPRPLNYLAVKSDQKELVEKLQYYGA